MAGNSRKVLLIQDSFHSIRAITSSLDTSSFDVITCSGEQAFLHGIRENPDVIIMDIHFRNRSGFQLLSDLKDHWYTRHIPIIVATHINTQQYWDESFRLGASAYMLIDRHLSYLGVKLNKLMQHGGVYVNLSS